MPRRPIRGRGGRPTVRTASAGRSVARTRRPRRSTTPVPQRDPRGRSGQGVVQTLFGGLLVDIEREGELGDEDLARPLQHALLACGQALVLVAAGEFPVDL